MVNKLPLTTTLLMMPTMAYAIPEQTIENNYILLLWASLGTITALLALAKISWDWINKKFEEKRIKIESQEEKAYKAEMNLRDQEIAQLKERVILFEKEHRECNRNLPLTYVTKNEYDKYMAQHREDTQSMINRFEAMMREFKTEIREDMSLHIERIIALISENKK